MRLDDGRYKCGHCDAVLDIPLTASDPRIVIRASGGQHAVRVVTYDGVEIHRCEIVPKTASPIPERMSRFVAIGSAGIAVAGDDTPTVLAQSDDSFESVLEVESDELLIRVSGEIELAITDRLNAVLATLEEQVRHDKTRSIVVDMSDVSFCDSTGVAFLLRAQQIATASGGRFAIRDATRVVKVVLGALALEGMLEDE